MSAYEELVERCRAAYDAVLWGVFEEEPDAREAQLAASEAFLAEVLRTLEDEAHRDLDHTEFMGKAVFAFLNHCSLRPEAK